MIYQNNDYFPDGEIHDENESPEYVTSIQVEKGVDLSKEETYVVKPLHETLFYQQYLEDAVERLSNLVNRPLTENELLKLTNHLNTINVKVPFYGLRTNVQKTQLPESMDINSLKDKVTSISVSVVPFDELHHKFNTTRDKFILAANGAVFKNQTITKGETMFTGMQIFLKNKRKLVKNSMNALIREGVPKSDYRVKSLNIEQKNCKENVNSCYGAIAMSKFPLAHPDLPHAITSGGRLVLCSTVYSFEASIGNMWFENKNDLLRFIIESNKYVNNLEDISQRPSTFIDGLVITENDIAEKLLAGCAPSYKENDCAKTDIENILPMLDPSCYENIYWRGNLLSVLDNDYVVSILEYILQFDLSDYSESNIEKLDSTGLLKEGMTILSNIVKHWVYIPFIPHNVIDIVANRLIRQFVILGDTDSNFINLEPYYQFVGKKCNIDTRYVDEILNINTNTLKPENNPPEMRDQLKAITEEYKLCTRLKITTLNVFLYLFGVINHMTMQNLCSSLNVPSSHYNGIVFKNEFIIKRLILTSGKKNYAGMNIYQEGALLNSGDGELDIKGLQMKKVEIPKFTSDKLISSLEKRILNSLDVDRIGFIKDLIEIESAIIDSIMNGEVKFAKPKVFNANYKNPERIDVYRATKFWNVCYPSKEIIVGDRVFMFPISVKTDLDQLDTALESVDNQIDYDAIINLKNFILGNHLFATNGVNWMAIPKGSIVPVWIRPLVNVQTLSKLNLAPANPILESLGVNLIQSTLKGDSYSTTVKL